MNRRGFIFLLTMMCLAVALLIQRSLAIYYAYRTSELAQDKKVLAKQVHALEIEVHRASRPQLLYSYWQDHRNRFEFDITQKSLPEKESKKLQLNKDSENEEQQTGKNFPVVVEKNDNPKTPLVTAQSSSPKTPIVTAQSLSPKTSGATAQSSSSKTPIVTAQSISPKTPVVTAQSSSKKTPLATAQSSKKTVTSNKTASKSTTQSNPHKNVSPKPAVKTVVLATNKKEVKPGNPNIALASHKRNSP